VKVLLVDDDPDIRRIGRFSLEAVGGLMVILAGSAAEALVLAAVEHPDLIMMDVLMPERDGLDAMAAIHRDRALCAIPVVLMTARAEPADERRYLELGAVGVIRKPFDPMTLSSELLAIVARR